MSLFKTITTLALSLYVFSANAAPNCSETPLVCAARDGDINLVRRLLEYGTPVNNQDQDSNTALHLALVQKHEDIANFLLSNNANVCIAGEQGRTSLHEAAKMGLTAVLTTMLNRSLVTCINLKDSSGVTALMNAAGAGLGESIQVLLKAGAQINIQDVAGRTAMLHAASLAVIKELIAAGESIDARDKAGNILMHKLALAGDVEGIKYIGSIRPEFVSHSNIFGRTPLLEAASAERKEAATALLDLGAPINTQDNQKVSPLIAVFAKHPINRDLVRILLDRGANPNLKPETSASYLPAIHAALTTNDRELIQWLVDSHGNINLGFTNDKDTILHRTFEKNTPADGAMALWLIEKGAAMSEVRENEIWIENYSWCKRPLIVWAASLGQRAIINALLDGGYDITAGTLCRNGTQLIETVLDSALETNHLDAFRLLLARHANVQPWKSQFEIAYFRNPLIFSLSHGLLQEAELLIQSGANLNIPSNGYNDCDASLLVKFTCDDKLPQVQLLTKYGAKLDQLSWFSAPGGGPTKFALSPLGVAAMKHQKAILELLIEAGGDVNFHPDQIPEDKYWSPLRILASLDRLVENVDEAILELLLAHGASDRFYPDGQPIYWQLLGHCWKSDLVKKLAQGVDPQYMWEAQNQNFGPVNATLFLAQKYRTGWICRDHFAALSDIGVSFNVKDKNGNLPIHYSPFSDIVIEKTIDIDATDENGLTGFLLCASAAGSCVQKYLDRGADVLRRTSDGKTALHLAMRENFNDSTRALTRHHELLDLQDDYGRTALHYAAIFGHTKNVKTLLDEGANRLTEDHTGNTALELARQEPFSPRDRYWTIKVLADGTSETIETLPSDDKTDISTPTLGDSAKFVKIDDTYEMVIGDNSSRYGFVDILNKSTEKVAAWRRVEVNGHSASTFAKMPNEKISFAIAHWNRITFGTLDANGFIERMTRLENAPEMDSKKLVSTWTKNGNLFLSDGHHFLVVDSRFHLIKTGETTIGNYSYGNEVETQPSANGGVAVLIKSALGDYWTAKFDADFNVKFTSGGKYLNNFFETSDGRTIILYKNSTSLRIYNSDSTKEEITLPNLGEQKKISKIIDVKNNLILLGGSDASRSAQQPDALLTELTLEANPTPVWSKIFPINQGSQDPNPYNYCNIVTGGERIGDGYKVVLSTHWNPSTSVLHCAAEVQRTGQVVWAINDR